MTLKHPHHSGIEQSLARALDLSPDLVRTLEDAAEQRHLSRGEILIREGSKADALYFVQSGRFTVFAGDNPIAEIGAGEPVGEVAFFGGGTRTASVVASRASDVLELSREAYEDALAREPLLSTAIITALARRLRGAIPTTRAIKPRPPQVIGIFPGGSRPLAASAVQPLVAAFEAEGAAIIRTGDAEGGDLSAGCAALRQDCRRVVLICEDPAQTPTWMDQVFQHCDAFVLCFDKRSGMPVTRSGPGQRLTASVLQHNIHVVVLRDAGTPIRGTADDLTGIVHGLHHHLEDGSGRDAARIARLVTGTGLGVVFGGGGAFGTAHLAMLKAILEMGIEIDMVGGTSVGAAMAGAFAKGLPMDEVIDRFVEMFVKSGAASRYTLPFWSIVDHTHFDAQLKHHYGPRLMAEDLPINFFALATSLTHNTPVVLRNGPLWKLIRASGAIPAVFPPLVMEDGEVLVDGGLIDNVPVQTMRELKAGPNLVLRLAHKPDWRVHMDYEQLPGRGKALAQLVLGKRRQASGFPGIVSIMNRALVVNSEMLQANMDQAGDVFVNLQRPAGMGFMQWSKGRELFDRTYEQTARRLETLSRQHSGIDLLRALANAG